MTAPKRYTNLYLAERRFGGPEEGGWYYDHFEIVRSEPYSPAAHAAMLAEVEQQNDGRYPLHSVLSTGLYVVEIEDQPGETRPAERPEYA